MGKKTVLLIIFVILMGILYSSCGIYGNNSDVIYVGFNLELTGSLSQYGQNCMKGADLAIKHINDSGGIDGKIVKSVVLDNRSESSDAALASIRLLEIDGVDVIIGPTNSNLVKSSLSANNITPMIIPSATANELLPKGAAQNNLYRICYTDSVQGVAIAEFARGRGFNKAVILTESSSDYSRGMSESFEDTFIGIGGMIVCREFYNTGEVDFYNILTKISEEDFDCIFIPGYYIEAGLIIRQMNELGISAAVLSGDAFDSPALEEIVGDLGYLNDIYFTNHYLPNDPNNKYFESEYVAAYGENPAAYAALGYDSVMIFAKSADGLEKSDKKIVSKRLSQIKNFMGITGIITIDENHNADKQVFVTEINAGKRIGVDFG